MSTEAFERKTTGLTKSFGFWDSFILAMGLLNLGVGSLLEFSMSLAFAPSYNFILSSLIGMMLNFFVVMAYSMITITIPRSGGDYVFVSRLINPTLGFANNFFWTVIAILGIAWNCLFMASIAVSPSLEVGGAVLNNSYMTSLSQVVTQPLWSFLIGIVTMLFIMVLMIVDVKWLKFTNYVTFIIAMTAVFAWIVVLAITPQNAFINSFNSFAQFYTNNPDSYHVIIQTAERNGMTISTDWHAILSGTITALPISYFTLWGANGVNYFSGEIKNIDRIAATSTVIPLIVFTIFTIFLGAALFNATGYQFLASLSYLAFNVPSSYALPIAPYIPLMVSIAAPNTGIVFLTLIGMICWLYLIVMAFYMIATRNLFAWSYDAVAPSWFSRTHRKYHTPVRSVVAITVIAIIGTAFYDSFSLAFSFTNFTAGSNSAWLVACVSAAVFPFIRKESFEALPTFVKGRIGPVPTMSIMGVLGAFSIIVMDLFVALNPAYAGIPSNLSSISLLLLGVIFVIGVIYFFTAKAIHKSRGRDLLLVYKKLPPE
jgi:amino acid transporter